MSALHPSVKKLGWVSFLNDAAAEMVYPLLPAFLLTLGATPVTLGMLEGFAEATVSIVRVFSGRLSDQRFPKKPLIVAGYLVSNLIRPLMGLASHPFFVIFLRVVDRLGKGLRSAPRDAVIAAVTRKEDRGLAFGFHQGMDHWGGVAGPLLASALLLLPWFDARRVFLFALIPGIFCVALTLSLVVPAAQGAESERSTGPAPPRRPLHPQLLRFFAAQSVFSLAASSDTFLLLRAQNTGVPLSLIAVLWAFHNGIRALLSKWGGRRSDLIGRRPSLAAGWLIYALVYLGFGLSESPAAVIVLFFFYAGFFALTDGAEKALVADFSDETNRGFAFGASQGLSGALLLIANLLMGFAWTRFGASVAFFMSAALSGLAAVLILALVSESVPGAAKEDS